jgi:ketosteroid isomerase-like protein
MRVIRFGAQVTLAVTVIAVLCYGQNSIPPVASKEGDQMSSKGMSASAETDKSKKGLDAIIEQAHLGVGEFVKGNSEPMKLVWSSHRDDITLGNPFGPFVRGWTQVVAAMDRAASFYKDGVALGFETVSRYETPELAYTVEIERYKASIGGKEPTEVALRCTSIFRRENGGWKLLHRHADPITTPRSGESLVSK